MSAVTEWLDAEWNDYASVKWSDPASDRLNQEGYKCRALNS